MCVNPALRFLERELTPIDRPAAGDDPGNHPKLRRHAWVMPLHTDPIYHGRIQFVAGAIQVKVCARCPGHKKRGPKSRSHVE